MFGSKKTHLRTRPRKRGFRLQVEQLELRLTPAAHTNYVIEPFAGGSSAAGYTPQQIWQAYGLATSSGANAISFNGTPGDGTGQTIAIVDAYADPNILSDLAAFDSQFGLPAPPNISVINENGVTSPLPAGNKSWALEESLDVEWSHAMAPGANIVLVEASSANNSDLFAAVKTAAAYPGVSVVSMSWGESEFSGESSDDSTFTTPANHQGVTFIASTGDSGSPGGYPAYSPNVLAAGGTSLTLNPNNSYGSEAAWSDSGGGISTQEPEPSYQLSVQSTGHRTIPDVSFDADPNTGVAVYDSYTYPSSPWVQVGGTSVSAPCWAGIIAIVNQGRVASGSSTLIGSTQTLPGMYSLPEADFHDITSGSNGQFSAGVGYDEVTGIGTPVANLLIPGLVSYDNADLPHLSVSTAPPGSVSAGSSFGFSVEELVNNSVNTSFSGTVTVQLLNNPGGSTLGGTLTTSAVDGVATFSGLSLNKVGTGYTLLVTTSGANSATTSGINVIPGTPSEILVSTQPPTSVTQNASFSVGFAIADADGNIVTTDSSDTITVSLATGTGTLSGTKTVSVKNGVASFTGLSIGQAGGGFSLEATSATNGSLTGAQTNTFAVTLPPSQLAVTVLPTSVTAGSPFSVTVAVEDSNNNVVTNYSGNVTVALSANPGGSTLGGTLTAAVSNGLATFSNLTLNKPGTNYALKFSTSGLPSTTSAFFNVVVGASRLVVTTQPAGSVTSAVGFGFTVSIEDALGNVATNYSGTVSVAISANPGSGVLSGTTTVNIANGQAVFTGLSINKAGVGYTLLVSSNGLTSATTNSFSIVAANATHLAIISQPSSVTVGAAFSLVVAAEDAQGNVASFTGSVQVTPATGPTGGTLGGTTTVSFVNGEATFTTLTVSTLGSYTLKATNTALGSVTTTSFSAVSAPSKMVVTTEPPSSVQEDTAFTFAVSIENASGNVVTSFNGLVTVSLAGLSGSGSVTVQAVNGVATFDVVITRSGLFNLSVTSSGLPSVTTTAIDVTPIFFGRFVVRG